MVRIFFGSFFYLSPTNICPVLKLETLLVLSENSNYDLRSAYETLSPTLHHCRC
jgi:hypothetical protein